jgi:hypothetical protein
VLALGRFPKRRCTCRSGVGSRHHTSRRHFRHKACCSHSKRSSHPHSILHATQSWRKSTDNHTPVRRASNPKYMSRVHGKDINTHLAETSSLAELLRHPGGVGELVGVESSFPVIDQTSVLHPLLRGSPSGDGRTRNGKGKQCRSNANEGNEEDHGRG